MNMFLSRKFLPLFQTQFLGAFNDNMLKNALVMLLTYRLAESGHYPVAFLVTIAGTMLIVPAIVFSSLAGQLADMIDKARLIRAIKLVEIGIMVIATTGFMLDSVTILFIALFCMGLHSTFFGPVKLSILPQQVGDEALLPANAYIEAGTFLAILLGTLAGGVIVLLPHGELAISVALIIVAVAGYVASRGILPAPSETSFLRLNWNLAAETMHIIAYARRDKNIFLCILGAGWFWFIGATLLSQVAPFVKDVLHADAAIVTLLLGVFSVGIGIGSYACNRLLRGHLQMTYVPLAIFAISLFAADLYFATRHVPVPAASLTLPQFLHSFTGWRIIIDFLLMAFAGGLYIVPLYAQIQHSGAPAHLSRLIAAANVISSLFMVGSALLVVALLALGCSIPGIFLIAALLNLVATVLICRVLPAALMRSLLRAVFSFLFRVEVRGLEHYTQAGARVLIVANHTSFLDAALLAAFLPTQLNFAVNTFIARKWWMRPVMLLGKAVTLDPTNPLAAKILIDLLKQNETCVIFPEGRLTSTGALMKIYEGPGMIADKSGATLLPIRIDGAQYSPFSRLKGKVRIRAFPRITLTILPPTQFNIAPAVVGRARRRLAGAALYDVMSRMMFESGNTERTLFQALIGAAKTHGRAHLIAEDVERKPLGYGGFIMRSFILGGVLRRLSATPMQGVMLPNTVATAITFFALQAYGRTAVMLNFSAGAAPVLAACRIACLTHVITSRRFIRTAHLEPLAAELEGAGIALIYLEDVAPRVGLWDKLKGALAARLPDTAYRLTAGRAGPDAPAVVLFTSGSEGTPKGVALSHRNILANCGQLAARVDFGPTDKVMNILPMFHSFGLTGGTLLPILSGVATFYYPSPLHYRIVPELVYDTNATIIFGTDTFLSAYARFANPYDFHSVRYIFAGAEKLRPETRRLYADTYGVRIFEGYGATETAPVLAINTPMRNRIGSVGQLLPGIVHRLVPVPGIAEGGVLHVQGPNVMLGYLKADQPGIIQPPAAGWYDTGDIVSLDADGYVTIQGRQKRFAKIAGEMVSLAAVEAAVARLWPAERHAVLALSDPRKGEQLVLLTTRPAATRDELATHLRAEKLPELAAPRLLFEVADIPVLGTGKTDYITAQATAQDRLDALAARQPVSAAVANAHVQP